jgi:hypothetical protein
VKFVATKKGLTTNFFSPLSFIAVFGSGIRDPGSGMGKNQDPGSGINIPDPQHWCYLPLPTGRPLFLAGTEARSSPFLFLPTSEVFRDLPPSPHPAFTTGH